jgi:hypothetical protein
MEAALAAYDDVLEETGGKATDQDDSGETAEEAAREAAMEAAREAYDNVFADTCADLDVRHDEGGE